MRNLLVFILLLGQITLEAATSNKKEIFLNVFQVELRPVDRMTRTQSSSLSTALMLSKTSRTYLFAQEYQPQSIDSIKNRAKELSITADKIKVMRGKQGSIFYFEDDKYTYFYSTRGGKLIVGKNNKEKFDPSRVSLKVASL